MTKRFVEAHKGTISVASKIGKGTCFSVMIPFGDDLIYEKLSKGFTEEKVLKPIKVITDESKRNNDFKLKAASILVVEDEDSLRDYLITNLSFNYNVTGAENGKLALDKIKKIDFDIIVSDILMP